MNHYWWNGHVVETDMNLRRVAPCVSADPDLTVIQRHDPTGSPTSSALDDSHIRLSRRGSECRLMAPDAGQFTLSLSAARITFAAHGQPSANAIEHRLLQSVLPFFAALNGHLCLHAVAVSDTTGAATLWVGDTGLGKSTPGAGAVARGGRLICDDVALVRPTDDGLGVQLGARTLRLASPSPDQPRFPHADWFQNQTKRDYFVACPAPEQTFPVARVLFGRIQADGTRLWESAAEDPKSAVAELCGHAFGWEILTTAERGRLFGHIVDLTRQLV